MLFTPEQVSLILEDIDFQGCVLVASILGKEMLTDADKELLKKYKVNLDSLVINFPPAQQAYLFGRLVPILTPNQIGTISYKDFVSYLERNQYRTPTQREIEEYKIVANRSYSYIKGLGTRMKEMTTNFISEAELELATKRREAESLKVIKEELTSAVLERKAVQKITSDIAGRLNDWQRDWGRIVETELQNIYNLGNAQTIEEEHGIDALVYKEVFPQACRHCIRLYLTGGIGSRPKVFKLSELRANGTNIGKKVADWKPVEGATHPWCFNSGVTKIFTANGWKNIKDIEVGDLVLTHLNRFRPVTEIYKRVFDREEVEIFNIHFETVTKYGKPKRGILRRITGNHPVLVNGEWVPASKIKEGDFLERKELKCERCSKLSNICNNHSGLFRGVECKVVKIEKLEFSKKSPKYLYNFAVEEDESYLADGVIVHNCRCELKYLPEGWVWDEQEGRFRAPKVNPDERVHRISKVRIDVGDRHFEV